MTRRNDRFHRSRRIFDDLAELSDLVCSVPQQRMRIDVKPDGHGIPDTIFVEVRMRLLVRTSSGPIPLPSESYLAVTLPLAYPAEAPDVFVPRGTRLFHPHFGPYYRGLRIYQRWADYRPYNSEEGLRNRLVRIVNSLRFDPNYVVASADRIANREALEWYVNTHTHFPSTFPLDSFDHPELGGSEPTRPGRAGKRFLVQNSRESDSTSASGVTLERRRSKRFDVVGSTQGYSPEPTDAIDLDAYDPCFATSDPACEGSYECWLEGPSFLALKEHLGWGNRTEANVHEQGGLLLGRVVERDNGAPLTLVQREVPCQLAHGTPASLRMDNRAWHAMMRHADRVIASEDPELQIVGWYHTHPGDLEVFMSETDLETQRMFFSRPWQVAVVLNPQRGRWRVFRGREGEPCRALIVERRSASPAPTPSDRPAVQGASQAGESDEEGPAPPRAERPARRSPLRRLVQVFANLVSPSLGS